jgi:hypothetical protein
MEPLVQITSSEREMDNIDFIDNMKLSGHSVDIVYFVYGV